MFELLASIITFRQFSHRETNRSAHNFAKFACNSVDDSVWIEDCLSQIAAIIQEDKLCNTLVVNEKFSVPTFEKKKRVNSSRYIS